jgi:GWxTD domain-containing protein
MHGWVFALSSESRRQCSKSRGRSFLASLGLFLTLCVLPAAAREEALPEKYDRWLNDEVVYLISDEERKAFLRLSTDAERDEFIQEFWEVRNPLRGSGRNPVKEEHYQRIEYANRNFGRESNTPGWKTDMGRTYILLGKPESRAAVKGHSQIYPLELWFYRNATGNPSLPSFFHVLFYIPDGIGEYRYYRPFLDGPLKLARGTQFQTNRDVYEFLKPLGGDLARAAFSLIPGDPLDTQELKPNITSDLLVAKLQNYANDPWEARRVREARQLRAKVTSWFLVPDEQPLAATVTVLADPQGEYWLDYAVLVDDEKFGRPDGRGNLVVVSGFRLFSEQGELVFEDTDEAAYAAYDAAGFQPFLLARRIPLAPGKYRLQAEVANRASGRSWKFERAVEVGGTALTQPLLARSAQPVRQAAGATPFQYFGVQFVPAVDRALTQRDSLRVLFQINTAESGLRDYELEYVVAHLQDRNLRRTFTDTVSAEEFRKGRLLKARTLDLSEFELGEYRLVVNLRERGAPQVAASANVGFRVRETRGEPKLYVAGSGSAMQPAVTAYLRALACLGQKDTTRAAEYLRRAVETGASNGDAVRLLASLYFHGGRHEGVTSLYRRAGAQPFAAYPDSLAQVVLSLAQTGEADTAALLLADARRRFPDDAILATAARQVEALRSRR